MYRVILFYYDLGHTFDKLGLTFDKLGHTFDKLGLTFDKLGHTFDKLGHTSVPLFIVSDQVSGYTSSPWS